MEERNGKRRQWTAKEKLRIVLAALEPGVEVADLCRREGLSPALFYGWKKQLLSSADRIFSDRRGKPDAQEEKHEATLRRKDAVIAEITAENLELKKGLSG